MTTPAEQEPGGTPAQEAAYQIYGSFFLTPAEPMARGPFNHIVAIIQAAIDESLPKWEPIANAPKDGTRFLAIAAEKGFLHTADVLFIDVVPEDEDDAHVMEGGEDHLVYEGRLAGEYYGCLDKLSGEMDGTARYQLPITNYTHFLPLQSPEDAR